MNKKLNRLLQSGLWVYLLILLAASVAAVLFQEYYLAICEAGAAFVVLLYALITSRSKKRQIIDYIQDTTDALDVAIRSDSPVPKVILEPESGEIIWANGRFCQMVGAREDLIGVPLPLLLPDLDLSFLRDESVRSSPELAIGHRRYHIYGSVVTPKNEEFPSKLANLYFIDMTEYLTVKEEYARSRPVVSIILVDNYDELTNNLTENDVSAINVAKQAPQGLTPCGV